MSSPPADDDDATRRLRTVLTDLDDDLAHLRALRAAGAAPDQAERALRARAERDAPEPGARARAGGAPGD